MSPLPSHGGFAIPRRVRPFRALWIAWAVIALAVAVPLAMAKGHPPGFVFVPFVAAAWLVGHLLILGVGWLGRRLAASRPEAAVAAVPRRAARWIAGAFMAVAFLGATVFTLFMAVSMVVQHERGGVLGTIVIAGVLGVWVVHAAVLVGLAADRPWALPALRAALAAWGLWFAWMVVGGALDGRPGIVAVGVAGLALMVWLFFGNRAVHAGESAQ